MGTSVTVRCTDPRCEEIREREMRDATSLLELVWVGEKIEEHFTVRSS